MSGAIYMAEKNQIVNNLSIILASQFIDDLVVPQFLELKNGIFFSVNRCVCLQSQNLLKTLKKISAHTLSIRKSLFEVSDHWFSADSCFLNLF